MLDQLAVAPVVELVQPRRAVGDVLLDLVELDEQIHAEDVPGEHLIRLPYSFGYALEERLPQPDAAARESKTFDLTALRFETVCRHVSHSDDCTIVSALAAEQFKRDNWGLSFIPFEGPGNLRDLGAVSRPGCPRKSLLVRIGNFINQHPPEGTLPIFTAE